MSVIILQKPTQNAVYAKNAVPKIVLSATEVVNITVYFKREDDDDWEPDNKVFSGSYTPDYNGEIAFDMKGLFDPFIRTVMPSGNTTGQDRYRYMFRAVITATRATLSSQTVTWLVANAKMKSGESFSQYTQRHFLTHQPAEKRTTKDSPEFLTFSGDYSLKARFYTTTGGTVDCAISTTDNPVKTVNVSYQRLKSMVNVVGQLKGYYDIMLMSKSTVLATQRYVLYRTTGRERYFVFVNSLGGIDTLICQGESTLEPEATFNTGVMTDSRIVLDDTDDTKIWQQYLRFPWRHRNWIHELLTEKQQTAIYDPESKEMEKIVLTGIDFTVGDREQLAAASFTYMLADTDDLLPETMSEMDRTLRLSSLRGAESVTIEDEEEEEPVNIVTDYTDLIDGNTITFESLGEEGRIHLEGSGDITMEVSVDGVNFVTYEHDAAFDNGVAVIPVTLFVGDWVRITADTLTCVIVNYNTTE